MVRESWRRWDFIGIGLTVLCAIHCVATPILITSLPFFATTGFDRSLTGALVAVASIAIVGGAVQHGRYLALLPYALGAILLLSVGRAGHGHAALPISLSATGLFLAAHLINLHFCRQDRRHVHGQLA